jgi:hypothetical protein
MSLRMPAEHGAWGILIVPFACASAVAAGTGVPWLRYVAAAAVCLLSLFLLRGSLERYGSLRALRLPVHLALAAAAAAGGGLLVFSWGRRELLLLGAVALAFFLAQRLLMRSHPRETEKRSLAAELLGVLLLSLSAPAATIAILGRLDARGALVWLLNALFFLGGVLYVKYRVRGVLAHREFSSLSERIAFAWPVFVYHLLLLVLLATAVVGASLPAMVLAAFAPAVLRAHGLLFHLGRRFPIKRLGWSEIAHSLLFAALLVLATQP